ncbi:hypothetical protein PV325_003286 [Microctonus aethiopoides]|nr:hypothetical protein PV325_003286 [Microctonus aethiopoides]
MSFIDAVAYLFARRNNALESTSFSSDEAWNTILHNYNREKRIKKPFQLFRQMKRRRITRRSRANSKVVLVARTLRMARKCVVKNCEIDDESVRAIGLSLHKFPRDPVLRSNWFINCGMQMNHKPQSIEFICHRHFCRSDYDEQKVKTNGKRFILKKGSLPTIFDNYNNHPDPIIPLGQNSNVSYPQEDLDLINSEVMNLNHADSLMCSSDTSRILSEVDRNCSGVNSTLNSTTNLLNTSELSDVRNNKCHPSGDINDVHDIEMNENVREKIILTKNSSAELPPLSTITKLVTNIDQTTNVNKEEIKNLNVTKSDRIKRIGRSEKLTKDEQRLRVNRSGLKFFPDAKLEAKDFNEKWQVILLFFLPFSRVVETDWVDREVLIHFDKWSSRFDEWIPMDSSRLRVPQISLREPKMRGFTVGERILATWADGRKYPARVNAVLGNDRYDVLFDDGYAKVVRSSKMTKVASTTTKAADKVTESEPYIGSKQERRDKKRKHTIVELFQHKRRSKPDGSASSSAIKKDGKLCADRLVNINHNNNGDKDTVVGDGYYDSSSELLHGFENTKPKVKNYSRRKQRESLAKTVDTDHENDSGPEWIDGEPQGIESFVVDGNDGSRRSIIVSDKKLPSGWQKHFIQRRSGSSAGKWDVLFLHKLTGKKFRSRNDIRIFLEAQGQIGFDPDMFDFCIHRRKRPGSSRSKSDTPVEVQKKIKTILPKTKIPTEETDDLLLTSAYNTTVPVVTSTTSVDDSAVFIGGLRVEMEDSAYKCPKEGCCKTFRKENLLQMHIKHYHPEFSKYLGSTPNVADLAYARTIGESFLDITPKKTSNVTDRGGKLEKRKIGHDKSLAPTQFAHSPEQSALASPSLFVSLPSAHANNDIQAGGGNYQNTNISRDDMKFEMMSPASNAHLDIDEEISKKSDDNCAMSPGALFDMKIREIKSQIGIKTLLPVRPIPLSTSDTQRNDRPKLITVDSINIEKGKGYRKRQLSEYSSDTSIKSKRRHVGVHEFTDDYGDLEDSALDAEGPAALVYRFSRRKSDTKNDDNSQSSQLNDSHIEKSDTAITHNNNDLKDGGDGIMMMINGELVKVEQLRREEIINCTCGFMEEDGLMIQCDLCLCWQHGHCNSIEREKDVPEKYICFICRHPYRQRPSQKYIHDQDWIKEGKLPSFSKRTKNQAGINQRIAMLKRSYDLVSILHQVKQILQSLRVKINVAQKKDHPKLYLWAKNWDKSDIPKPNVEPVPILEIIKNEPESMADDIENRQQSDSIKLEMKPPIKDDPDVKSIASDTELMKILEGNATVSDDTKMMKNEDITGNNDGQILLDALTKNNGLDYLRCNNDEKTMGIKLENTNRQNRATTPTNLNKTVVNESEKSSMESKTLESKHFRPLQPFIPEPEAPIDPAECRLRLLEHIEHFQNHIEARLTTVEAQLIVLEVIDDDKEIIESSTLDVHPRIKQTIQMLLRDLNTQKFEDIDQHAKFSDDFQQPVTQEKIIAQQNREK